ncbi:MAG: efflux transporter outer membrane subunit [Desulfuromonadaceae bacterium]|nr:efflux transporter outer membrane subunit [Desulfuromonadaceae bacterium]MDD5106471.1 efflux transporter outer membrane subunit [Desulfuromonadaceae bacterium]
MNKNRIFLRVSSIVPAFFTLAACSTMAPTYSRPTSPVPATLTSSTASQPATVKEPQKPIVDIPWQDFFVDRQLRDLIALALKNNRDLRIAALAIERAQAQFNIRRSDLFPKINATAGGNVQRIPEDFSSSGKAVTTHQYSAGLGISSYELDLFGRVQSLKDQALQQYLATEQARHTVQISLVAQIAAAYLTLAADQERLTLARETLVSEQTSYTLIKNRFEAGISSGLILSQAQTGVDAARVDIARFTSVVEQDIQTLALLVGAPVPAALLPTMRVDVLSVCRDVSPGAASDLLLRRPDIRQAEYQLKGLNANIGAARAAFFPKINLISSVGFGSSELSGLFSSGSFAWSVAPGISLPIFDGGSNSANLKIAEVDRNIAVAQYEKTIQGAFREVADALALRRTIDDQLAAQQSLTGAAGESYSLSQARYEHGIDSYLNVLDSQRLLYGARQNLIGVRLAKINNLVTLYKVLGGGSIQ